MDVRVGDHRFGFNGKEKDSNGEWGDLTHYDYGFRIYNPGIAKFLSVDPLTKSYPWYTPYQFAGNTPIQAIDVDGAEPWYHYDWVTNKFYLSKAKIGPIPLEEANSRGLFTQQQAHGVFESQNFREWGAKQQQIRSANNQLAQHKALTWNPIWNLYQVSGIADGVSIVNDLSAREYGSAALTAAFLVFPSKIPKIGKKSYSTASLYFRWSDTGTGAKLPYFGKIDNPAERLVERYRLNDIEENVRIVLEIPNGQTPLNEILPSLESFKWKSNEKTFVLGLEAFLIDYFGGSFKFGGPLANKQEAFKLKGLKSEKLNQSRDVNKLRTFFSDWMDRNYSGPGDWREDLNPSNIDKYKN